MSNEIIKYMKDTARSVDTIVADVLKNEPEHVSYLPFIRLSKPKVLPSLARAVSQADGRDAGDIIPLLAAIEIGTCAQYIFDDRLDNQSIREGKPTSHEVFGEEVNQDAYNRLMNASIQLIKSINKKEMLQAYTLWINTLLDLQNYQQKEFLSRKTTQDIKAKLEHFDVNKYLDRCAAIAGNPASKICGIASLLSHNQDFSNFGLYFGMACQLRNDALDYLPEDILKKSKAMSRKSYEDLRQEIVTFPLFTCYQHDPQKTLELVESQRFEELTVLMANNGTVQDISTMSQALLEKATYHAQAANAAVFEGFKTLFDNTAKYFANYKK